MKPDVYCPFPIINKIHEFINKSQQMLMLHGERRSDGVSDFRDRARSELYN